MANRVAAANGEKQCSSCRIERYSVDAAADSKRWQGLAFVGLQLFDHGEAFELRNCPCGSTLAWPIDWAAARRGRVVYLHIDFQLPEAA